MPATSKAQQRLFGAAEHGADFPKAAQLRASLSKSKLREFASTSTKGLPEHASRAAMPHPHKNLGAFLHPKKAKAPRLADNITALRSRGAFRPPAPRGAKG